MNFFQELENIVAENNNGQIPSFFLSQEFENRVLELLEQYNNQNNNN